MNNSIPIWLDCDPGHDDAVAILIAAFYPHFKLLGVSTTYGNAALDKTTYNAMSLLTAMKSKVKVYPGSSKPFFREQVSAPDIHGETGLDGTDLLPSPDENLKSLVPYLDAIEQAVLENSGEIAIVATGALTNLAKLITRKPHLREKIKCVSIMGGSFGTEGNINPNLSAEFNIWADPRAANIVFSDPIIKSKTILIPLNLTHQVIATSNVMASIEGKSVIRHLLHDLFVFFAQTYKKVQGFENGPPVHDPVTLLPLLALYGIYPESLIQFKYKSYILHVEEEDSSPDLGKCNILSEDDNGIKCGFGINVDFFWQVVYKSLEIAEKC